MNSAVMFDSTSCTKIGEVAYLPLAEVAYGLGFVEVKKNIPTNEENFSPLVAKEYVR